MPKSKLIGVHRLRLAALLLGMICSYGTAVGQASGRNELVSVRGPNAVSADGETVDSVVSPDGRYVAFSSLADNLVAGDNNQKLDVFEADLLTGTVTLVSRNQAGTGSGNASSQSPAISADGRYVAFSSMASDLASLPIGAVLNVFVRDMQTGTTTLVSVNSAGTGGGNNGGAFAPVISADGRVVVFTSTASNLVANDTNGATADVFARDLTAGTTLLASANNAGTGSGNGPSGNSSTLPWPIVVSADGRYVAFTSSASNLVAGPDGNINTDVFRRDLQTSTTALVSVTLAGNTGAFGGSSEPVMSANGRYVAFVSSNENLVAGDNNGLFDIFRRDMQTGMTALVNANLNGNPSGQASSPAISADGRYVVFVSAQPGFVANDLSFISKVYRRDMDAGTTALASSNSAGTNLGNRQSLRPAISADGRVVTFLSLATNLVANDTNGYCDVFARDFGAGTTRLVSSNGANTDSGNSTSGGINPTNGVSNLRTPAVSADGRYVVFVSHAFDLVAGDANGVGDLFRRDLLTEHTELITRNNSGSNGAGASGNRFSADACMSADGRYLVFTSAAGDLVANDVNGTLDIFRRDMLTGETLLVSVNQTGTASGNSFSQLPALSADGRYVAFQSYATDLVPNNNHSGTDIYVRDMITGTTQLVTIDTAGSGMNGSNSSGPALSADGRYVAFTSNSPNLVTTPDHNNSNDVFVRDTVAGTTALVSINAAGTATAGNANGSFGPVLVSADGRYVAFLSTAGDLVTNSTGPGLTQAYVRDRMTGTTKLVSISATGTGGNGNVTGLVMSPDGRYFAFADNANNLLAPDTNNFSDIFVRDNLTNTTTLVSVNGAGTNGGNNNSSAPALSPDGRFVAFVSTAGDLVATDTNNRLDVFRRDLQTGATVLVSSNSAGTDAGNNTSGDDGNSTPPAMSADARYVLFTSQANNLVANDLNGTIHDVFIRDMPAGVTQLVSLNAAGTGSGDSYSTTPILSADGRYASFNSSAGNLAANDANATADVFRYRVTDTSRLQFSAAGYTVREGDGQAIITVTRSGDLSGTTAAGYQTVDEPAAVRCDDTTNNHGTAYARCDYATTLDTITFAPGETSKTFGVPIIDDAHAESSETFQLQLVNPPGTTLDTPATAVVTIMDNDVTGQPNPIFQTPFFVRQQYLDFLAREPEAGEPWSGVLNRCADVNNLDPNSPSAGCDRLTVSASFFGSPEFQLKGYFVYRFYKLAFNRLPDYAEIVPDMRTVTGTTAAEVFQKKGAYINSFAQRPEFLNLYSALSHADYVNALLNRYQLSQLTTPDPQQPDGATKVTLTRADLLARLDSGTLSRAQILRAVADSDQVYAAEYNQAFVAMQYYGYLRRTPEAAGYQSWLNYLTAQPTDFRTMVNGFMNSQEYRLRFGQP